VTHKTVSGTKPSLAAILVERPTRTRLNLALMRKNSDVDVGTSEVVSDFLNMVNNFIVVKEINWERKREKASVTLRVI
jgi:hypothetical protein